MKDVPLEERKQILLELETEKSRVVRERHNISPTVISHIRFYHGRRSTLPGESATYYHKTLLPDNENDFMLQVKKLKEKGLNSGEVAERTGFPLSKINKIWTRVDLCRPEAAP